VTVSPDPILSETRNEWQKAVADIHETLALGRLAAPMLVQYPICSDIVVQTPAFVVGFVFQNTAIIFTERSSDVIRPPKYARENICRFDSMAQRTGEDVRYGNRLQILRESDSLLLTPGCQTIVISTI
jgi:hypothetical protein